MSRFADWPPPSGGIPQSVSLYPEWQLLRRERAETDTSIIAWADKLEQRLLDGDLTWHSNAVNRDITKPRWLLVTHFFNHQTHHRGQVHCMLTQAGGKPHDTDLQYMPE
jgi:uncharacterized damage-inducible protein DinB